ncbi:DMT family transporter [Geobacter sulfurreducens]|uniref:Membrane protein, putative n=1 Tax=Geobacter sulfurreducens (strain ATCC 51573 / DSM 12127 / PCA) TaxID=243231 RepID=Q746Y0_GEOSL|nr:DMT family transporter [Geobacter sulfurreducens]AAR36778.1 membrane protein, putative [Geobacter sulfurreducens PCA]AJY69634.1 membrane protein [Geobacter sulfurreducens]UAC04035.1 DMT family transporter [Geobacter sulfurreducens]UTG92672.1 DMT family transporter [Geobacter sulfurreducens]HBB70061.1 EamA/RhaT family transporter [Geobacter sulfurreducens]
MDSRKALDGLAVTLMIILCLTWGLQQVALKATSAEIAPLMQIAIRSGISALLVGIMMAVRGERLSLAGGMWRPGLAVGFLFALEYLLVGEGLRHTTASHMVIFLYTAPVFAAIGLHLKLRSERLRPVQWFGIALAFGGIVVSFYGRGGHTASLSVASVIWGDVLGLAAGMAWGMTTVVIRTSRLAACSATQTLLFQLLGAFILLLPAAAVLDQTYFNPTRLGWACLIFQTLIVSFASFLVWFWLLRHYVASRLGVLSFMTPLFGVALGAWLLNEPLERGFLAGALLVLTGIILVSGHGWLRQLGNGAGAAVQEQAREPDLP